jgi:hypothetical protein
MSTFRLFPYCLLIVCFTFAGCSKPVPEGLPKLYPLTLTFVQEGEPCAEASILLVPQDSGNAAGDSSVGTSVYLMPFMEMNALFDTFMALPTSNSGVLAPWNIQAFQDGGPYQSFICPSSGALSHKVPDYWPNNYVYCTGDALWALGAGSVFVADNDPGPSAAHYVGDRTMFFKDMRKTFSHVADGTSNTVVVSECLTPAEQVGNSTRENIAVYYDMQPEGSTGASPYGVWGALGSPDGGEATSL